MNKTTFLTIGCILAVVVFQAFTVHQPGYQNLKILPKDISKDDMDSVMHHFTASLGVKCNYCHVRNEAIQKMDFANDSKPEKLVARKMMLMSIDINTKYFKEIEEATGKEFTINAGDSVKHMLSYVTCYTCHRGSDHPESKVPKKEETPKP